MSPYREPAVIPLTLAQPGELSIEGSGVLFLCGACGASWHLKEVFDLGRRVDAFAFTMTRNAWDLMHASCTRGRNR